MTVEQRQALERARTRIARLQPDVIAALLAAFRVISAALTEAELARFIATGAVEHIVRVVLADAILERATMPVRLALRSTVEKAFRWNVPYLPNGGKINGTVAVVFDNLNPRVLDALRSLEGSVVDSLKEDVRQTAIDTIAKGLERRDAPTTIARDVRAKIGISPRGAAAIENFRSMLERGDRQALTRELRDRRFDATLEKSLGADGKGLTPAQVDKTAGAYQRSVAANEAETISRSATLQAYKAANDLSWRSAIERGIVDGDSLRKQWIGVGDDRERDSHLAMNDQVVSFFSAYSNGQIVPGEGEFNCRCISRVFVA